MTTVSLRSASLISGISLAAMAVLAPLGVMLALPAGETGVTALIVLLVAALDVVVAVGLYPLLARAGALLALSASGLRVAYAAVFATAAGSLVGEADVDRFQAIWDAGLMLFGLHLVLVGVAMFRVASMPSWIGALVVLAGLGYVFDAVVVTLGVTDIIKVGEFAFVGEVALLVWLIGWGGRGKDAVQSGGRAQAVTD